MRAGILSVLSLLCPQHHQSAGHAAGTQMFGQWRDPSLTAEDHEAQGAEVIPQGHRACQSQSKTAAQLRLDFKALALSSHQRGSKVCLRHDTLPP